MPLENVKDRLSVVREERAGDGVRKYLLRTPAQNALECVLIPGLGRSTLCVSSQSGCPVACSFCATGQMGLSGQLAAEDIVAQLDLVRAEVARDPDLCPHPITNIVYMGMGEPFLNFDAVVRSVDLIRKERGFHSHIMTVSTIGIPDKIVAFGDLFPHVRLAVSLHAPDDELRTRLIPLNKKHPIKDVLDACRTYQSRTQKKVFFEYVMIRGVNDDLERARRLAHILEGLRATVNLIPLHPGGSSGDSPADRETIDRFRAELKKSFSGHVTFRRTRGQEIRAACGQLAVSTD